MYKNLVPTSQKTCRLAIIKNRTLLTLTQIIDCYSKGKVIPLQARSGPEDG